MGLVSKLTPEQDEIPAPLWGSPGRFPMSQRKFDLYIDENSGQIYREFADGREPEEQSETDLIKIFERQGD